MRFRSSSKPRVIALEGPAGVGKTTLSKQLLKQLTQVGVDAQIVPEFSQSDLGKVLATHAAYGQAKPSWTIGMAGTLAFIADKVHMLEIAAQSTDRVWICDRFVTSQLVLGLRGATSKPELELTENIIILVLASLKRSFSDDSVILLLEASHSMLKTRLETRLGRSLTLYELRDLADEINRYAELSPPLARWQHVRVHAEETGEELVSNVIETLASLWT